MSSFLEELAEERGIELNKEVDHSDCGWGDCEHCCDDHNDIRSEGRSEIYEKIREMIDYTLVIDEADEEDLRSMLQEIYDTCYHNC